MKEKIVEILKDTNGELKYCEQMVAILVACGYSTAEAEIIRKDYGKKYADKIAIWEKDILNKCRQELGSEIIQMFSENAHYLYHKCHLG